MKKILLVDDSALMRRVFCDIINSDKRFFVEAEAINGVEALELLKTNTYDAVVLDVNMPKMDGITLLKELKALEIPAKVLMASTLTKEGAQVTLEALELGALDFIHKPDWAYRCREEEFKQELLSLVDAVTRARILRPVKTQQLPKKSVETIEKIVRRESAKITGKRIVAIACSTGGPRALQSILPQLPDNLKAPIVLVQHMPVGFTLPFAQRMDSLSKLHIVEAKEGETLEDGVVYLAQSGHHMNLVKQGNKVSVHYSDEPAREGVRPCANYMYESLAECDYDEVICVVMTGMGADGTEGIANLKKKKKTYVIAQDGETCVVNGMPGSIVKAGLSDQIVPLPMIAQEIILHVGVK
ncbi:MAG: chemotaxis response regulator protein-glutamate methylesterase [Lachnospiraceae bacterium]